MLAIHRFQPAPPYLGALEHLEAPHHHALLLEAPDDFADLFASDV